MEKKFSETSIRKDSSANELLQAFERLQDEVEIGESNLYYKYPFYNNENQDVEFKADFLAITQNKDVHIFSCINFLKEVNAPLIIEQLDKLFTIIDSKLRTKPNLKSGRNDMKFVLHTHVYCEESELDTLSKSIIVFKSNQQVIDFFSNLVTNKLEVSEFRTITSVIEGIDETISPVIRNLTKANSKGTILSEIENSIINYDTEQFKAITTKVEGFQRIRGLAGTGKTIILARKVAELHRDFPDKKILITYYTKALHDTVKKHITRYYKKFSRGEEPNWDNIDVLHSWGGYRLDGVYHKMCLINNVEPIDFGTAKRSSFGDPFEFVCKKLLENLPLKKYYDYILIDEGQDFKENFYRLCLNVSKSNNIIWAYDDFQDILKTNIQNEKLLFGKDENGDYYADFSQMEDAIDHDIILKKCYRNSKNILTGAFSLGMGVYNQVDNDNIGVDVLQKIESNRYWEDIGFKVIVGDSNTDDKMIIERPLENSPDYKELFFSDNLINFIQCENIQEECEKVVELIINDLKEDLKPIDICVICLDNARLNDYYNYLTYMLNEHEINVFNLQKTFSTNVNFSREGHITLSSIYRAKGNEVGSVYIMGVDSIFNSNRDVYERNKLFTAITRSKGWVSITGTGENTKKCINEYESLLNNDNQLIFIQPSDESVRTIKETSEKIVKKKDLLDNNLRELASQLNMSVDEYIRKYLLKE